MPFGEGTASAISPPSDSAQLAASIERTARPNGYGHSDCVVPRDTELTGELGTQYGREDQIQDRGRELLVELPLHQRPQERRATLVPFVHDLTVSLPYRRVVGLQIAPEHRRQ